MRRNFVALEGIENNHVICLFRISFRRLQYEQSAVHYVDAKHIIRFEEEILPGSLQDLRIDNPRLERSQGRKRLEGRAPDGS